MEDSKELTMDEYLDLKTLQDKDWDDHLSEKGVDNTILHIGLNEIFTREADVSPGKDFIYGMDLTNFWSDQKYDNTQFIEITFKNKINVPIASTHLTLNGARKLIETLNYLIDIQTGKLKKII